MVQENLHVIVGLGITGLACARFCANNAIPFAVTDSRDNPPGLDELKTFANGAPTAFGGFSKSLINQAACLLVSPGVSLREPLIQAQQQQGVPCIGDIELFAQVAKRPVAAITGSNGKTTVTTLLGQMAVAAHKDVVVAGNIGDSALDSLIAKKTPDLYVLELSSFQLERTFNLKAKVATILNICEDHMDRYDSLEDYVEAKQRIYDHAECAVYNRDDPFTKPVAQVERLVSFGLDEPEEGQYGVIEYRGESYLAKGSQRLLPVKKMFLQGTHHVANALAALALGEVLGLNLESMVATLSRFKGVPHRCQLLRTLQGVSWYNDSKGTNVGATEAALKTVGQKINGKIVLIAGGVGKGADFTPLQPLLKKYVRRLILIGEVAEQMAMIFQDDCAIEFAKTMSDAVEKADLAANRGDAVLLSPACASFDMFTGYEHRGDVFAECVKEL